MNSAQIGSAFRSILKIAGSAATVLAIVNPQWGTMIQLAVGSLGSIGASIAVLWGLFHPVTVAQSGLTSAEAADALNMASLAKAKGQPIVKAVGGSQNGNGVHLTPMLASFFFIGLAASLLLGGCSTTGTGGFADSPPVVKQNAEAAVLDVRYITRGAVEVAKETAKALLAILKPITEISDLPFAGL